MSFMVGTRVLVPGVMLTSVVFLNMSACGCEKTFAEEKSGLQRIAVRVRIAVRLPVTRILGPLMNR